MQRIITTVLGLIVAIVVAFSALAGGNTADAPEVGEAPVLGGNTPLAPDTLNEDLSDPVPFIKDEPVYDLDSIPVYDEQGNLVPAPYVQP